jgi:hypothetical protein
MFVLVRDLGAEIYGAEIGAMNRDADLLPR